MTHTTLALLASVAMGAIAMQQAAPASVDDLFPGAEREQLYRQWGPAPEWIIGKRTIAAWTKGPDPKELRRILPPEEYEKPYLGNLTITRYATEKEVDRACPKTKYPYKLGCAHHSGQKPDGSYAACQIILAFDSVIAKAGLTFNDVFRHEIGHCNGWPGTHWGARMAPEPSVERDLGLIP